MLHVTLGSSARSVANAQANAAMMQPTECSEIIRSNRPPSASNLAKTRILLLLKPLVEVSAQTVVVMMVMVAVTVMVVVVVGAVEAVVAEGPLARMSSRMMRMGMQIRAMKAIINMMTMIMSDDLLDHCLLSVFCSILP